MLILQYITGNELPTLPYTVYFRNILPTGSTILSLALLFAPGTLQAFYSAIYARKIGGGNGLGIKTSDIRERDLLECFAHAHYSCVGVTAWLHFLLPPLLCIAVFYSCVSFP